MPWVLVEDLTHKDFLALERGFKRKARFLADEHIDLEIVGAISSLGWNTVSALDVRLARRDDEDLFQYARREDRILLTQDQAFWNDDQKYPPERSPGIVVLPGGSGQTSILIDALSAVLPQIGRYREVWKGAKIVTVRPSAPPADPAALRP